MTGKVFDAHFHIIDPRYPLIPNRGFLPDPFTVADYRQAIGGENFIGGVVVSGSFQGFDQGYLVAALEDLGPGYVGVTQLPETVSDAELERLDATGVRGLRFNLKRGGSADIRFLAEVAARIHDVVGWHVELYADAAQLGSYIDLLTRLPAVSIDHLGLSKKGIGNLLRLAEKGVAVKASGFGRVEFDVEAVMRRIVDVNPNALMFGTDLPSTRAPRPYSPDDLQMVRNISDPEVRDKILFRNARGFYRLG